MDIILGFVSQYPIVASILFGIGAFRVVFKPVFAIGRAYVDYTPNPADNLVLDKIEQSKAVKGINFVLDYLFSIKLVK